MEQWIPRYETLSQLNESSLFLVRNGLKRFMDEYGPFSWPIDCFRLLCDIQRSGRIQLYVVESSGLPGGVDARTWYFAACGYYLMIRKSVPENWQAQSGSRRCNFTMAHELGHIFLGHLDVPEDAKSEALRSRENAEADEFASRLLMPEDLVLNACFPSRAEMAAAFLVSEQALFHRLNNLRRLDRLNLPPAVCPACGNRRISPCASRCRMCGASLGRKIPEGTALKMRVPFPERCPVCGSDAMPSGGECPDCGYPVYNRCRAEYNRPSHINPPDARFCETCGASTLYAFLAETPGIERGMPLYDLFHAPRK